MSLLADISTSASLSFSLRKKMQQNNWQVHVSVHALTLFLLLLLLFPQVHELVELIKLVSTNF